MSTEWSAPAPPPRPVSRARTPILMAVAAAVCTLLHALAPQPLAAMAFTANSVMFGLLVARLVEDRMGLTTAERMMIRVGAPIALLVLGGLVVDVVPGLSLSRSTWALVVGAGVHAAAIALAATAGRGTEDPIIGRVILPPWAIGMVVALGILPVVTVVISVDSEAGQPRPPFSALSAVRAESTVRIRVENAEQAATDYLVRVTSAGTAVVEPIPVRVEAGATWQGNLAIAGDREVEVTLALAAQPDVVYRQVRLARAPGASASVSAGTSPSGSPSPGP